MDRISQLKNVAFGGAWSEQIAGNEALRQAFDQITAAVQRTLDEDLEDDLELRMCLRVVSKVHPKGSELLLAWDRALRLENGALREVELDRLSKLCAKGLEARLAGR